MIMPGLPGATPDYFPYPYDPAAAQESMALALQELGYASAADIPPLRFGFNTGAGHEPRVAFLAQAWEEAFGLETEQIGSEFGVFLTQRTAGEYDLAPQRLGRRLPALRTTRSLACSRAVAATTTTSTATRRSTS